MQQQQSSSPEPPKKSIWEALFFVLKRARPLWQARQTSPQTEVIEKKLDDDFLKAGIPLEGRKFLGNYLHAWQKARKDDTAFHKVDRYLVGAMGVFDLVLFQIIAALGVPDRAMALAWIAFTIAFPCVAGSLFFSFLKKENGIILYGNFHSFISFLAQVMTITAAISFVWHIWFVAGVISLCLVILVFIACVVYSFLVAFGKYYLLEIDGEKSRASVFPQTLEVSNEQS
jgi:cation transport ATPase